MAALQFAGEAALTAILMAWVIVLVLARPRRRKQ